MSILAALVDEHVARGGVPGMTALVSRAGAVEVASAGLARVEDGTPMTTDTIVRATSISKIATALTALVVVEDGALTLDSEIRDWLPELTAPRVVRTPASPLDDTVAAKRPVTVRDLLTSCSGWGFSSDFSAPAVAALGEQLRPTGPLPAAIPGADDYLAVLARTPMLHQPGAAFLYDISLDVLGILLTRVTGRDLPGLMAERLLDPLGMADTGFSVPAHEHHRFASLYDGETTGRPDGPALLDPPTGQWAALPPLASGAGGLVTTLDDWHTLCRLPLGEGEVDGLRLLPAATVRAAMTDQLTPDQRGPAEVFLDGQGWGYGGGVDIELHDPWNVLGRYGWVGGTGTSSYVIPSTGTIAIALSQLTLGGPSDPDHLVDVWRYAAG